jgi:hypothetical protein
MNWNWAPVSGQTRLHFGLLPHRTADASARRARRVFTTSEDVLLIRLVKEAGERSWDFVSRHFSHRSARQCKERYFTYLAPTVRTDPWTRDEDNLVMEKVRELGPKWTEISASFTGRSPNAIKNRYHLQIRARSAEPPTGPDSDVDSPALPVDSRAAVSGAPHEAPQETRVHREKVPLPSVFSLLRSCEL